MGEAQLPPHAAAALVDAWPRVAAACSDDGLSFRNVRRLLHAECERALCRAAAAALSPLPDLDDAQLLDAVPDALAAVYRHTGARAIVQLALVLALSKPGLRRVLNVLLSLAPTSLTALCICAPVLVEALQGGGRADWEIGLAEGARRVCSAFDQAAIAALQLLRDARLDGEKVAALRLLVDALRKGTIRGGASNAVMAAGQIGDLLEQMLGMSSAQLIRDGTSQPRQLACAARILSAFDALVAALQTARGPARPAAFASAIAAADGGDAVQRNLDDQAAIAALHHLRDARLDGEKVAALRLLVDALRKGTIRGGASNAVMAAGQIGDLLEQMLGMSSAQLIRDGTSQPRQLACAARILSAFDALVAALQTARGPARAAAFASAIAAAGPSPAVQHNLDDQAAIAALQLLCAAVDDQACFAALDVLVAALSKGGKGQKVMGGGHSNDLLQQLLGIQLKYLKGVPNIRRLAIVRRVLAAAVELALALRVKRGPLRTAAFETAIVQAA